ncbi:MAG: hypothetical protein IJB76_05095 [Clostridia bacterium]|nr:hypothetical protein [Clostridia bacterium]
MDKNQKNALQSEKNKNSLLIPFVIALIGALLLVATIFLPFASATEEHQEYLQKHSEEMYAEEINMTNEDAVTISIFEFGRIYAAAISLERYVDIAIACLIVIVGFALLVALTTLFAVLKKAIITLIFNLLSFGAFQIIKWDFEDRGVLPSSSYDFGIAQYACYVGIIAVMVGAVALLVAKIKNKKQLKSQNANIMEVVQ